LCCIQATQQCGAEGFCCCAVYRLLNSVAQRDFAVVLYTGYLTVWRRGFLLLCCIKATQQCGAELSVFGLCRIQASQHVLYNYVCFFSERPLMPTVFRRVRKIAISGYLLCHACLSVHLHGTTRVPQDRFSLD